MGETVVNGGFRHAHEIVMKVLLGTVFSDEVDQRVKHSVIM